MKKIMIIALALIGSAHYSADAQQRPACKAPDGKVCKKVGKNGVACYKTPYAHNFKICKSELGYYVCCEEPNLTNSTFPALPLANVNQYKPNYEEAYAVQDTRRDEHHDMNDDLAPQSQSYPYYSANTAVSYEGYYPKKRIRVCNNTNNVAEANKDAYEGCPTPAYDGPDKNKTRNVNVSNPSSSFPIPPNSGNKQ